MNFSKFSYNPFTLSLLASSLLLAACGNNNDDNDSTDTGLANASVSVKVSPASSAYLIHKNISTNSKTNDNGYAVLNGLPSNDRVILNVGKTGYALQTFVESLTEGQTRSLVDVELLKLNKVASEHDSTKALTVTTDKDISLTLAANSLQRTDSSELDKSLTVYVTDVDITNEKLLPKSFTVTQNNTDDNTSVQQPLEILSAVHVKIQENETSETGTDLDFLQNSVAPSTGSPFDLSIPVSAVQQSNTPSSLNLYVFDNTTASWKISSTLTLNSAKTAYTGSSVHTGYLALATPIETVSLTGCVVDASDTSTKLTGAEVILEGTSYSGFDKVITNADGKFTLNAKAGSDVSVQVKSGQYSSELITVTNASTQVLNNNECIALDIGSGDIKSKGTLTWEGDKDYDINVILPNLGRMFYNARIAGDGAAITTQIIENTDKVSEDIRYTRLMTGNHFIFVHNYYNNFDKPMSESNTKFVFDGQTFTPPAGEKTTTESRIVDDRTPVWLAAVMNVDKDCNITVTTPDTNTYKTWLTEYEYVQYKFRKDGEIPEVSTGEELYCTLPASTTN